MPTVQHCRRNGPWLNPQMSEIGRWLGLCQQPGLMVESVKMILDCKKENGRYSYNLHRIKKTSLIEISVMPLMPLYSPKHGICFITVMEATVFWIVFYNNNSSIVAFRISSYLAYATGHKTGKIVKVVWEKFSDFLWF